MNHPPHAYRQEARQAFAVPDVRHLVLLDVTAELVVYLRLQQRGGIYVSDIFQKLSDSRFSDKL